MTIFKWLVTAHHAHTWWYYNRAPLMLPCPSAAWCWTRQREEVGQFLLGSWSGGGQRCHSGVWRRLNRRPERHRETCVETTFAFVFGSVRRNASHTHQPMQGATGYPMPFSDTMTAFTVMNHWYWYESHWLLIDLIYSILLLFWHTDIWYVDIPEAIVRLYCSYCCL